MEVGGQRYPGWPWLFYSASTILPGVLTSEYFVSCEQDVDLVWVMTVRVCVCTCIVLQTNTAYQSFVIIYSLEL